MSLETLESNLQEIYSADFNDKHLVANLQGTKVYNKSHGWGLLWRFFYIIFGLIINPKTKLEKAIVKTYTIFQNNLKKIQQSVTLYREYLINQFSGFQEEKRLDIQPRKSVNRWNRATRPFVKLVKKGNSKVFALFRNYLKNDLEKDVPLFNTPNEPDKLQKLIEFECQIQENIEYDLLEKLAMRRKMRSEKELKSLMTKIKTQEFPIRKLHHFFYYFVNFHTQYIPAPRKPQLSHLEYELYRRDHSFFDGIDRKHIKWRESLDKENRLFLNGREITLGDPLEKKEYEDDEYILFEIKNDPKHLVIIGENQATLNVKKHRIEQESWGIRPAKIIEIEKSGKFALVEKLETRLDQIEWKSKNGSLDPSDTKMAKPLIMTLKWFLAKKYSPKNIKTESLFIDDGVLKTHHIYSIGALDFKELEKLVFDIAKGNRTLFSHIMRESKLSSNKYAKFYKRVVKWTLKKRRFNISTEAALYEITSHKIVDQAELLKQEILKLKKACLKKLHTTYKVSNKKKTERLASKELLNAYTKTSSAGILWPNLQDEIVKQAAKSLNLKSKVGNDL